MFSVAKPSGRPGAAAGNDDRSGRRSGCCPAGMAAVVLVLFALAFHDEIAERSPTTTLGRE